MLTNALTDRSPSCYSGDMTTTKTYPTMPYGTTLVISDDFPEDAHIERYGVVAGASVEFLEDSGFEGEVIVLTCTGFELGMESRYLTAASV